jgi:NDP-sugar pyrophosphorylase family protein
MIESAGSIRAFVLCGGLGTRLRPVLTDRPKSMAPIAGVPFLELLLRQLKVQGIREVVLGTGYRGDQIESHLRDGARLGLTIRYSRETDPLGTGGALKLAEPLLSDPVVVINGDSYIEWDLPAAQELFVRKGARLVMILQAVPDVGRYGSVAMDAEQRVTAFVEKGSGAGAGLINGGVYLLKKDVVSSLPAGKVISLERDVFPQLLAGGSVYGKISDGFFIDIGIPADLERAQTLLATRARD